MSKVLPDTSLGSDEASQDYDYEDPIGSHRRGANPPSTAIEDTSSEEESEPKKKKFDGDLELRDTVLQGSFLPVTCLASKGAFPVNEFIFD